ncbi:Sec14d domain containing protein [Cryptosporidium ryanae]|uniref:Sec14d domain containing protein n=1 Tax=Cryptosporidium ryanae TaxID=515981 RepID=UPI003519F64B|nr:Sec14d domain containing protein [Cryptosporidium ryanae]
MLNFNYMKTKMLDLEGKESDITNEWSEIVKKISKLDNESNNTNKRLNFSKYNNLSYTENLNSFQDTKNLCSLSGEIIRRNGVPYLILDFLKKLLYLRGYYCLTKEDVLMQLSKYSVYMYIVEDGMNKIYEYNKENKHSTIKLINENKKRILVYNVKKVLSSGVGLKFDKQPVYYIRVSDLNLKVTMNQVSVFELRQLIVWELERVMDYFSKLSVKEKKFVSHIAIALDLSNMEIYSCKFEFQLFMKLLGEIIENYSPLLIDTIIIHKVKSLKENLWCCIEPIIEYMRKGNVIALFTENDNELWNMLKPINTVDLHSRGGFINNSCLYPICGSSKAIPNLDILVPSEYYSLDNYMLETYEEFFLSLKPKLSTRKFISECMKIETDLINKLYWVEEQKLAINDEEIKEFDN